MPFCEVKKKKLPSIHVRKGVVSNKSFMVKPSMIHCFYYQILVDKGIKRFDKGIQWYSSFVGKLED